MQAVRLLPWLNALMTYSRLMLLTQLVKSLITGYVSQPNEYDYWMPDSCVEGQIPRDLDGTLFRNGEPSNAVHVSFVPSSRPDCSAALQIKARTKPGTN